MKTSVDIRRICGNCDDFNSILKVCTIRYLVSNGQKQAMPRREDQKGCAVFMFKIK